MVRLQDANEGFSDQERRSKFMVGHVRVVRLCPVIIQSARCVGAGGCKDAVEEGPTR
jgi:hypothetical protein